MTKQEIAQQLQQWIDDGKMLSKKQTGKAYAEIDRNIKKGIYYVTRVKSVLATDEETQRTFNDMYERKEVFSFFDLQLEYPQYKTLYSANKAAANGEFLRFGGFQNIPLFIKGE